MNKHQLDQSLKDIIPTFSGSHPPALVSYIDSLYQFSLQKLPKLPSGAEVARYHLCAYLAVERYQQNFLLPAPDLRKVPLKPALVDNLLDKIQYKVMASMTSPASMPFSTPQKRVLSNFLPSKRPHTPSIGSPLKKLQKLLEDTEEANVFAMKSPFNPDGKAGHALRNEESPFNVKTANSASSSPLKSPSKSPFRTPRSSPLKNEALSSPLAHRYHRQLAIPDFISFANNFYIPASVTPLLLETFMIEKYKFVKKNEWLLACGLIHAAYMRINDKLVKNTIGKKAELQDQLFQYQKGGLMRGNMIEWIKRIEESVKSQLWALDLELKYVHDDWTTQDTTREREIEAKLGSGWDLVQGFGAMVDASVMYSKASQVEYYNVWTRRAREKIRALDPARESVNGSVKVSSENSDKVSKKEPENGSETCL